MPQATPAKIDDSATPISFPAVGRKKLTAAFDGGRLTSDGGVLLLAQAERAMGICAQLAACIADRRDPARITHKLDDILGHVFWRSAVAMKDADDLDTLRDDPGFRLALGKLPGSGAGLASQPTMSRWENAPTTRELARMMGEMIGKYCASYPTPPAAVTLDIDDTCDVVHGYQQLSFWNGHHGERCFMPIHVYDTATGDRSPCCCVPARAIGCRSGRAYPAAVPPTSAAAGPTPTSRSGVMATTADPK